MTVITKEALIEKVKEVLGKISFETEYNDLVHRTHLLMLLGVGAEFNLLDKETVDYYSAKGSSDKSVRIIGGLYLGALGKVNIMSYNSVEEAGRVYVRIDGKKSYVSKRFIKVIE